jgi:hypothetical protein
MFFDTDRFEMITIYCVVYCIPDLRRLNGTLKTPIIARHRSAYQPKYLLASLFDFHQGNTSLKHAGAFIFTASIRWTRKKNLAQLSEISLEWSTPICIQTLFLSGGAFARTLQTRPQTKMKNEYLAGECVCVRFRIICSSTPRLCAARQ